MPNKPSYYAKANFLKRRKRRPKAEEEYKLFNPGQQIDSDFDKHLRGLLD